jgi:hypothetical protein
MSKLQTCFYCGKSFYPGSSIHGNYFGVKTSKFSAVQPVCSKKCEVEFNTQILNKNQNIKSHDLPNLEIEFKPREIHTSLKSTSDISVTDISLVINEIVIYCRDKGYHHKSYYFNKDESIDSETELKYQEEFTSFQSDVFYLSKELIQKRFKFSSEADEEMLWNALLASFNEEYSPNMGKNQIQSLAENVFEIWKKSSSKGCFGVLSIFVIILIFIHPFI